MKSHQSTILLLLFIILLTFFQFVQPYYKLCTFKYKPRNINTYSSNNNDLPYPYNNILHIHSRDNSEVVLAKINLRSVLISNYLYNKLYNNITSSSIEQHLNVYKKDQSKHFELYKMTYENQFERYKFNRYAKLKSPNIAFELFNAACIVFVGVFFSNYLKDGLTGEISEFGQFFDKLFLIGKVPLIIFLEFAFYSMIFGMFIKFVSVTVNKIFNIIKRKFIMRM